MRNFKKDIFRSTMEVNSGNCVHLNFFDYKGLGDVTFTFTRCDGAPGIYTYGDLPNTGGNFATWDAGSAIVQMPCYLENTLTVTTGRANNFVTSPCTPTPIQSFPFYVSLSSSATMTDVCGYLDHITLYTDSIYLLKNSYLYTDANLSIPFVGNSLYRDVESSDMNGTAIKIDSTGKILEVATNSCYVPPPALPALHFSADTLNALNTCTYTTFPYTHYGYLGLGSTLYSEPTGLIPIVGLDHYMKSLEDGKSYRVNNSGVITDVYNCLAPTGSASYRSGRIACIGGYQSILSAVSRGTMYWRGTLQSDVVLYQDFEMTQVVPYGYIEVLTSPKRYIELNEGTGIVTSVQNEGNGC